MIHVQTLILNPKLPQALEEALTKLEHTEKILAVFPIGGLCDRTQDVSGTKKLIVISKPKDL